MNTVGLIANLLSVVLWFPQARITWKSRNNPKAIEGISLGTQFLTTLRTIVGVYTEY